jgi:hypothetical protein
MAGHTKPTSDITIAMRKIGKLKHRRYCVLVQQLQEMRAMPNFTKQWVVPFKITVKLSDLNYRVIKKRSRDPVVHTNRLKAPTIRTSGRLSQYKFF